MSGEPILVQLLFASPELPAVDLSRLLDRLRERFGDVSALPGQGPDPDLTTLVLKDLPAGEIDGQRVPTSVTVLRSEGPPPADALRPAVEQTWDWPGLEQMLGGVHGSLVVMPMLSWVWLDRATRLAVVHATVEALLAQADPVALHWPTSQRLVAPHPYLRTRAEAKDPLYPASNVRLFRITNGEPGEVLMDTVGLAPLGLPDLQIRFSELRPPDVAAQLFNLALYLFQNGDVIQDGHTVEGVPTGSIWQCRRGYSALAPSRDVIDLLHEPTRP
jgi:hypothetical protein